MPHAPSSGTSVVNGEHRRIEALDGVQLHRGHPQHFFDINGGRQRPDGLQHIVGGTDEPENDLRRRVRRHHVRSHASLDQPDAVVGRASLVVSGERQCPQPHERVDEQVDRGDAVLGKRGVIRTSACEQFDPQHASRERRELAVGRLAVDQVPVAHRVKVRQRGAVAAALLADDEQQADPAFAAGAEPIGGGQLRGQDPLGVARSSPVQPAVPARWTG